MGMYIIFFGKSQDFTTCYYDRNHPIRDFNSIIKDFDLLESKTFTVDDIKNKEILSRYNFTSQGQDYCLLKLYSFAQAFSGNRIAGSIYGVGLLSDKAIAFTKENLGLLRAAKDNFAKLSLDGVKFNKSNFQDDSDRIWKAIVSNNDVNLLDKVATSSLITHSGSGQVSFFVKNLFSDAITLNDRIANQDVVYFSEDLEHLKRTQNKWGKDSFPIYWEQGNQYVPYKEPVIAQQQQTSTNSVNGDISRDTGQNDIAKLRAELADSNYTNRNLQLDVQDLKDKQKSLIYILYGLSGLILLLLLYIMFFSGSSKKEVALQSPVVKEVAVQDIQVGDPISVFLANGNTVDSGLVFFKAIQYIYSFDVKKSVSDSNKFHHHFEKVQNSALENNIDIENIQEVYIAKCEALKKELIAPRRQAAPEGRTSKPAELKRQNRNGN